MTGQVILAVVAHPDDEVLGAGGTLARHAQQGDQVHLLFLTDGVAARANTKKAADGRARAATIAAKTLGTKTPLFLSFPDNRLDGVDRLDVIKAIEDLTAEIQPTIVYTHHAGDLNIDHQICSGAVLTAFRPMPGRSVRRILAMEVASSTEWNVPSSSNAFIPNHFVDISGTLAKKRAALDAYAEEMRDFPHTRSTEALEVLARWRGATVGLAAAEAFVIVRSIET